MAAQSMADGFKKLGSQEAQNTVGEGEAGRDERGWTLEALG